MLDETRRSLLDAGYFCVTISYNAESAIAINEFDTDLATTANMFWKRAVEQLRVYTGDAPLDPVDTSVFCFGLFQRIVHGAWEKLQQYHPNISRRNRLIILVDDFSLLLESVMSRNEGTDYRSALGRAVADITQSYRDVYMAFSGLNVTTLNAIIVSASSCPTSHLMLPPIGQKDRMELLDIMLMSSVANRTIDAAEYNVFKSSPGLLAAKFVNPIIPWEATIKGTGPARNAERR